MAKKKKLSCFLIAIIVFVVIISVFFNFIIGIVILDKLSSFVINTMYSREGKKRYNDISLSAFDGIFNVKDLPNEISGFLIEDKQEGLKYGNWNYSEISGKAKKLNPEKEYKPDNYDAYTKILCNYIINQTKVAKSSIPPTLEETLKLPIGPDLKYLRYTARLWAHVSILLDAEGKDKESLIVAFGIYYLSRYFELNYRTGGFLFDKLATCDANNIADVELLRWASKPRPSAGRISKYLAKDLLKLVDAEIQPNRFIDYQIYMIKMYFKKHLDANNDFIKYCCYGDYVDNRIKSLYDKVDQIITLPYAENKERIKKLKRECDEELYVSDKTFFDKISSIISRKAAVNSTIDWFLANSLNVRDGFELKLAKMEMAAIALAYNSFYSEKRRVPASIEELEKWFGQKLPVNRLNNKQYKLYEIKGYVLYNNGINDECEQKSGNSFYGDDFFFIFNEK